MHAALKTLLICLLIGLSFGTYLYFNFDHRPERIFMSVMSSVCIGTLMMLVLYYRRYFTAFADAKGIKTVMMIVLLIVTALLGSELTFGLRALLFTGHTYRVFDGGSIYILNVLIVLVTGIPIYVSEEWKDVLNYKITSQQYRVLQLEQQQAVFELELLRAKINPHFLYNVHNTIAGLISKDPTRAEEMVLLLSKFFRFTLNKNSATFHPVSDEIEIITTYLHMQQIRFEDRMEYKIVADPQVLPLPIASFVLQPLVENAVKHGIEPNAEKGFVHVTISGAAQQLCVTIADSGPAFSEQPGSGMGLQMVMNKLKLLYADNFKIEFNNPPQKYVRLTIPG